MQLAVVLSERKLLWNLGWVPRLESASADDLTNDEFNEIRHGRPAAPQFNSVTFDWSLSRSLPLTIGT